MLRMERVEVGIILLAERGWALPARETFWSGRGWRASHAAWGGAPGVSLGCYNRPHTPRQGGCRETGTGAAGAGRPREVPSPTLPAPAVALRPQVPGRPWRRTGRGCDLHPQNLLPCWARCRLVLLGRVGFAISIPPPDLGPPPEREPGETHGRGRIVGGPRAPNRLLRHVCASAFQKQRRLGQSGPVPIEAEDESWKRGMRACRWGLRLLGDSPPPKTPSSGKGPVTRAFEAT